MTKCKECGLPTHTNLKFCGKVCRSIGKAKRMTGVNHPNWKAKPEKLNIYSRKASDRMFKRFGHRKVFLYAYSKALEDMK